jgi:hypothetical protein
VAEAYGQTSVGSSTLIVKPIVRLSQGQRRYDNVGQSHFTRSPPGTRKDHRAHHPGRYA